MTTHQQRRPEVAKEAIRDLKAVREILADPSRWLKGKPALDAKGRTCLATHPDACKFCLAGALIKVRQNDADAYGAAGRALNWAARRRFFSGFVAFNDDRDITHAGVLSLIDEAIKEQQALLDANPID